MVDQHEIFQKQWVKRRRFYMKCKYEIREAEYKNWQQQKDDAWNTIYDPSASTTTRKKQLKNIEQRDKPKLLQGKCMIDLDVIKIDTST